MAGEADQAHGQPGSEKWVTWRDTSRRLEKWLREKASWRRAGWDCEHPQQPLGGVRPRLRTGTPRAKGGLTPLMCRARVFGSALRFVVKGGLTPFMSGGGPPSDAGHTVSPPVTLQIDAPAAGRSLPSWPA